jgi:hypothetical protein
MPRKAATSAMATVAAESARTDAGLRAAVQGLLSDGLRSLLFHAGWLVQAQLGMALSWSWAGGLGGVALWWACLAAMARRRATPSRHRVAWASLSAAAGLALAMTQGATPLGLLGWGLNLLSWAWLCSRHGAAPRSGRPLRLGASLAGLAGMLLAALLAAGTLWPWAWPLVCALFLVLPWLRPREDEHGLHALSLPMGLMMGSLLPMAQWCASQGWSPAESAALHLAAMALGLHLAAAWHPFSAGWTRGLWALAALLCLQGSAWAMLASACVVAAVAAAGAGRSHGLPAWTGPGLLLVVGQLLPTWGPDALRLALAGVFLTALLIPCTFGEPGKTAFRRNPPHP